MWISREPPIQAVTTTTSPTDPVPSDVAASSTAMAKVCPSVKKINPSESASISSISFNNLNYIITNYSSFTSKKSKATEITKAVIDNTKTTKAEPRKKVSFVVRGEPTFCIINPIMLLLKRSLKLLKEFVKCRKAPPALS